jgi:hypothetical protein
MKAKGAFGAVSEGNEKHVTEQRRKSHSCYKVPKNLAALCSRVLCKEELINTELRYLAEISEQC